MAVGRIDDGPRAVPKVPTGGKAKALYEDVYCRRGAAESHIKSWKTQLAADRISCSSGTANQFRLFWMPAPTG